MAMRWKQRRERVPHDRLDVELQEPGVKGGTQVSLLGLLGLALGFPAAMQHDENDSATTLA